MKERDLQKLHEEYEKLLEQKKGYIYMSDILQIMKMRKGDIYGMIAEGLEVGIVIGYRIGKREARKNKGRSWDYGKRTKGSI